MRKEKRERKPCQGKVRRDTAEPYYKGIGVEYLCPECGSTFLVATDRWAYTYKGIKYCRYNCKRAVERRDEK